MMKKHFLILPATLFALVVTAQKNKQAAPPPPPPPVVVKKILPPPAPVNEYETFLKQHPLVKALSWSDDGNKAHVHLKSGKEEVYNLNVEKEAKALKQKYGTLPVPPPPPPVRKAS